MESKHYHDHPKGNPWKTLATKPIYSNPWISVREDQVLNPSGGKGIYGVVSFKNLAIGIVPVDNEGNTWLVGQYRYTLQEYHWEIPEGGGPLGIEPLESAKRELLEETGITANKWTFLSNIHTSNSVTDEVGYLYLAQDLIFGTSSPEETEQLRIWKLPLNEAIDLVMQGKITDSLSMAGLLMVGRLLL
jgi:8-oxo-dGTP pyrophosphatase MutT (NUDIX family)